MLTHPNFDPVAISIGPLSIHWYGLTYLAGFAFSWLIAAHRVKQPWSVVKRDQIDDLIFYAALGVVLGGRCGYVLFYNFEQFLADPIWLFKLWDGGMSFHGGLLGVITAMLIYAKKINIRPGELLDFVVPMVPIGLGFGRIGNFIGQELWGRPSDVPWAMIFTTDPLGLPRHPSQLYQACLEGLLLFVIVFVFTKKQRPAWSVGGLFLIGYGCMRFFVEFFRQPDNHIGFDAFGWLTRGQILCIPMILIGIALMVYAYKQPAQSNK